MKKHHWFNSEPVKRAVGRAASRNMTRAFYVLRRKARDLLGRKVGPKGKVRPPGSAPRHRTTPGFKLIKGNYDFRKMTMVMGPVLFVKQSGKGVPGVHEHGQTFPARVMRNKVKRRRLKSNKAKKAFLRKVKDGTIKVNQSGRWVTKVMKYPERPFMKEALRRERKAVMDMWRDSVKP